MRSMLLGLLCMLAPGAATVPVIRSETLTLYIAGHTDTVGPAAKNATLSEARAIAIGQYLRGKHLAMPIVVAGLGEALPKVATPDETDEPANRRADYVLGPAGGTPPFQAARKATWKPLR